MKAVASAFAAGVLFAVGLAVAGMTQPAKIVGFLDFFGHWDPSLMLVMGGAVTVHFVLYRLILKRSSPLFAARFQVPTRRDLTPALLGGSALFGIGWGLGGFCPGPGLTSLGAGRWSAVAFVAGMFGGFVIYRLINARRTRVPAPEHGGEPSPRKFLRRGA